LDEATIFNSSCFGFLCFQSDAIKDLKVASGEFQLRREELLLLDIYQKDGNSKGFHVNGGIGLISSRICEGPLVKTKDRSYWR
jgi:hypothetical protein